MKRSRRPQKPARARGTAWMVLVLVAIASLTYAGSFDAPFIFDDLATVVENPQIRGWSWTRASTPPAETPMAGRPLAHLSIALNHAAGGLDPSGYRTVNLALHLACAVLLFRILLTTIPMTVISRPGFDRRIARDIAFVAALLWTIHPLNSEVVNYVTQRTESMMALFYLLTVFAAARSQVSTGYRWHVVAVTACLAGALSKESIATAPIVVVLYDRVFFYASLRQALQARWRLYTGLSGTWLLLGAVLLLSGQSLSGGFAQANVSPWTYLLNQSVMITRYLQLAVWPGPLVIYYGWPQSLTLVDVWPYAFFICVLLAATIALLRLRPHVGFWAAWFFLTLAPTSSVLPIATEVGAERRMYLPLAGLIVIVVMMAAAVWQHARGTVRRRAAAALLVMALLVTGAYIARSVGRTREYASGLTMAMTVLERWPTPNAYQLVGTELARLGRHEEAIPYLREAVGGYPPARYFLGSSLLKTGALEPGVAELRTFIDQEPDALAARGAHGLVADALAQQDRFSDAIPHYREYLRARPDDADAWNGLGVALAMTGATTEAVDAFGAAARLAPGRAALHLNLARALFAEGRPDAARAAIDRAVRIDPSVRPAAEALLAQFNK